MSASDPVCSSPDAWDDFLKKYYHENILKLAKEYPDNRSIEIKFRDINNWSLEIAQELLDKPDVVLRHIQAALQSYSLPADVSLEKAHIRIINLPEKLKIDGSLNEHIGKLVSIQGMVQKASTRQIHTITAAFKCQRCGHTQRIEQPGNKFVEPFECDNNDCGRKGPFQEVPSEAINVDRQVIEVCEPPEERTANQAVHGMRVVLDDDLAGLCNCGDRVEVAGILRALRRTSSSGKFPQLDLYIDAISLVREVKEYENLVITKADEEQIKKLACDPDIYSKLVRSIAPSIYGYDEIKEAIVLQLFRGVSRKGEGGTSLRGNIHVLLVGDPGVAKSQLLRYTASLAPRGIHTIGTGSTKAGLTAAAVKDQFHEGRWTLEAGALVQADKGYIAVDELEKLHKDDQVGLHEALEQQTVSIAKAGITTTLNARCSCLAAANPKYGTFDRYESLPGQIGLSPPLLSRFDLIFLIQDVPDPKRDKAVIRHVLKTRWEGSAELKPPVEQNILRKYIAYAQREISPVPSKEASLAIEDYYLAVRKKGTDPNSPVPITVRSAEALIRLSEASTRVRLSNEVSIEDVQRAIRLVEASMGQVMTDPETGALDSGMISTGVSKSQRDRMNNLRSLIEDMQTEYHGAVPLQDIIEKAAEAQIKEDYIKSSLDKLKQSGDIIEVKRDHYKWVN